MDKTATLSAYLRALFVAESAGKSDELKMPKAFDLDLLEDCHFAVDLITRAIKNQSEVSFLKIPGQKTYLCQNEPDGRSLITFKTCAYMDLAYWRNKSGEEGFLLVWQRRSSLRNVLLPIRTASFYFGICLAL